MQKIGFNFILSILLFLTIISACAAEAEKSGRTQSPYEHCGWNCLGWVWSDQSLKNNVIPIENVSETISKLNAYSYTWNENDETSLGLVAQNVEQADPRLVREGESGLKQVYVPGVVALLLAEVKSLRIELNTLNKNTFRQPQ